MLHHRWYWDFTPSPWLTAGMESLLRFGLYTEALNSCSYQCKKGTCLSLSSLPRNLAVWLVYKQESYPRDSFQVAGRFFGLGQTHCAWLQARLNVVGWRDLLSLACRWVHALLRIDSGRKEEESDNPMGKNIGGKMDIMWNWPLCRGANKISAPCKPYICHIWRA